MAEQKLVRGAKPRSMTREELYALPVSFDIVTAGRAYGIGRTLAYELAKREEFPCTVRRVGDGYRVTRADLFRGLGISEAATA